MMNRMRTHLIRVLNHARQSYSSSIINKEAPGHYKSCEQLMPTYQRELWYPAKKGEIIHSKYKIVEKLGYGTSSTVWLARDLSNDTPRYTSLKILANLADGAQERELEAQQHLACLQTDHPGKHAVQHRYEAFTIRGPASMHQCISYPLMSTNVLTWHEDYYDDEWYNRDHFKWIFKQLLLALDFLHSEARIVHTDVKLDSLMLAYGHWEMMPSIEESSLAGAWDIKTDIDDELTIYLGFYMLPQRHQGPSMLCDFGQARFGTVHVWDGDVQPQLMRAPEVVMHMPWDYKIDIWNAGCVLWNLYIETHLFKNVDPKIILSDDYVGWNHRTYEIYEPIDPRQYLCAITSVLGSPPSEFLSRGGSYAQQFFDASDRWQHQETHPLIETSLGHLHLGRGNDPQFIDIMQSMLQWLPEKRKTARELLDHPFLRNVTEPKPLLPTGVHDYSKEQLNELMARKAVISW